MIDRQDKYLILLFTYHHNNKLIHGLPANLNLYKLIGLNIFGMFQVSVVILIAAQIVSSLKAPLQIGF